MEGSRPPFPPAASPSEAPDGGNGHRSGRAGLRWGRDAYAAQPSYPAKEEVTVVVSAPNSAARKRTRPSSSAARDSRVPASDGVSETAQAPVTANANAAGNGRAGKAREELAAVPAQDPSAGGLAGAGGLDGDADLDGEDLDGAVDLEDFDLDDDALAVEVDLEIVEVEVEVEGEIE